MKTLITILITLAVTACCPAHAGSDDYETRCIEVLQILNRVVIPIEFKAAEMRDVCDVLEKAALKHDPLKQGVSIRLFKSPGLSAHPVTISANNITLLNALDLITSTRGLKYSIDDTGIIVLPLESSAQVTHPPSFVKPEMISQSFSVKPSFIDSMQDFITTSDTYLSSSDIKKTFLAMGIPWPPGSSIQCCNNKLTIKNTEENLGMVKTLLRGLNLIPMQTRISAQFVQLDFTNFTSIALTALAPDELLRLCTNTVGRQLGHLSIVANNGQTALIKTSIDGDYPALSRENTLLITPEILPSGNAVKLSLKWASHENPTHPHCDHINHGESNQSEQAQIPLFCRSNSWDTLLSVNDGQSVLASGGLPSLDGKGLVYCIITPRLIDFDENLDSNSAAPHISPPKEQCTHAANTNTPHEMLLHANETRRAMDRIIIPEIDFKNLALGAAIDSLIIKAKKANEPLSLLAKIVLLPSLRYRFDSYKLSVLRNHHAITLSARNISLWNVLNQICTQADLCIHIKGKYIVLSPKGNNNGLIPQVYYFEPPYMDITHSSASPEPVVYRPDIAGIKSSLSNLFISPPEATVTYFPLCEKWVLFNTAENHLFVTKYLQPLRPSQVQITAQFFEINSLQLSPLNSDTINPGTILNLCTNGTGRLLAAPSIITALENRAVIKGTTQGRYQAGIIMEVIPEIQDFDRNVELSYKISLSGDLDWPVCDHTNLNPAHPCYHDSIQQPPIGLNLFESKLTLKNGHSVIAFAGLPTRDATKFIYCVITIRLLDQGCQPLCSDESSPRHQDYEGRPLYPNE